MVRFLFDYYAMHNTVATLSKKKENFYKALLLFVFKQLKDTSKVKLKKFDIKINFHFHC